jgi:ankyrin repeat protein
MRKYFFPLLMSFLSACASLRNERGFETLRREAYQAMRQENLKEFQECFKRGLPLDYGKGGGETPLHWTVHLRRPTFTEWLVEKKADVNAQSDIGYSPLHWAAYFGQVDIVKILLRHGADPNLKGGLQPMGSSAPANRTPLHVAAREGRSDIAKLLVDHGADAGVKNYEGLTPLHVALSGKHQEIAQYLLRHAGKIDVETRANPAGATPLLMAVSAGYATVAVELIQRGADVNARGGWEGNSALHFAARNGDRSLVELLLSKGADPSLRNKAGLTPTEEADKAGKTDVAALLRRAAEARGRP